MRGMFEQEARHWLSHLRPELTNDRQVKVNLVLLAGRSGAKQNATGEANRDMMWRKRPEPTLVAALLMKAVGAGF